MSEAEFDSYLSLLSKFLRLRSRQRADLADELRDHLESRLDELLAQGKTREQAAKVALEEFGDAAVLATEFSRLASRRTKRFVMRCTAASAAVVAAVVLLSVAFAPPGPNGPGPNHAVAQPGPGTPAEGGAAAAGMMRMMAGMAGGGAAEASVEQQAIADLDAKLGKVLPKIEFVQVPLRELINQVAAQIEADALIDEQALTDSGVNADDPVDLRLTRTKASARTALGFALGPKHLTFVNRAGVIYITTRELADELLTTKVYNVRDLLENATTHTGDSEGGYSGMGMPGMGGMYGGGSAQPSVTDAGAALALLATGQAGAGGGQGGEGGAGMMGAMMSGMGSGGGGMGGGVGLASRKLTGPAGELVYTIENVTPGPWFEVDGVGGTVTVFNGLLVVRQTEQNHAEIQRLLDALREAGRQPPGGSVAVPKQGTKPPAENGAAGVAPRSRPTREEFEQELTKFGVQGQARMALVNTFRSSGGRRTLNRLRLLAAFANERQGPIADALQALNIEPAQFAVSAGSSHDAAADMESPSTFLLKANSIADERGEEVEPRHLLLALLDEGHESVRSFLSRMGVTPEELRRQLTPEDAAAQPPGDAATSKEGADPKSGRRTSAP